MKDELRDRLATLLSTPAARGEAVAVDGVADDQDFVRSFLRRAERVVYPAMLEVGRMVERHGRFFSIELIGERSTRRGLIVPTSVQMNFFRRQKTTNFKNACPHFNVVCDKAERRVVFRRAATMSGSEARVETCGRCTVEQLTRDLVQDKLVASLDALLAG